MAGQGLQQLRMMGCVVAEERFQPAVDVLINAISMLSVKNELVQPKVREPHHLVRNPLRNSGGGERLPVGRLEVAQAAVRVAYADSRPTGRARRDQALEDPPAASVGVFRPNDYDDFFSDQPDQPGGLGPDLIADLPLRPTSCLFHGRTFATGGDSHGHDHRRAVMVIAQAGGDGHRRVAPAAEQEGVLDEVAPGPLLGFCNAPLDEESEGEDESAALEEQLTKITDFARAYE